MCGFIISSYSTVANVQKVKADAIAALAQAEEAEESLEKRVTDWGSKNLRWLKGRKKKKKDMGDTVAETGEKVGLKSNWLASFEKQLQPKGTLKADGDVTQMQIFKKSMYTWMNYVKEEGVVISNQRYWHILANMCDETMCTKLEAINGVEDLGEEKIWQVIEGI